MSSRCCPSGIEKSRPSYFRESLWMCSSAPSSSISAEPLTEIHVYGSSRSITKTVTRGSRRTYPRLRTSLGGVEEDVLAVPVDPDDAEMRRAVRTDHRCDAEVRVEEQLRLRVGESRLRTD